MKFGIRMPSLKRRLAARTSWKRIVRHNLGLKAPRGMGFVTNPKRALYNRVYNKTSVSVDRLLRTNKATPTSFSTSPKTISSYFLINLVIFLILTAVFFPLGIGFLVYKLYQAGKKQSFPSSPQENTEIAPSQQAGLSFLNQFYIPEPTRSLLWITDEDTSKISTAGSIKITINVNDGTIKEDFGRNFYGEPSLIWSRLPIEPNYELETQPMYFPSYSGLSSKHRFQYLNWLKDITQETNLSYVFLYYYGLERHMLIGDYDKAVDEILRLLQHHSKGSFKGYATSALIAASAYRKRPDIINKAPLLLQETSNESLILRKLSGKSLVAKDIIPLSSRVGYSNKRYIKLYPDLFEKELQKLINDYETINGNILDNINMDELPKRSNIFFANLSLPEKIRTIEIPDLIDNSEFKKFLRDLLSKTHENVKMLKGHNKIAALQV
ncbi:hypothetical protein COU94_02970 [Candidatus Shapirobacteria bacterium CG10_big_fil_rev_8_21_14_0_10_38_8]|nr:MAG: hypothetical protein COU94_02970 [Candidatus Shapirobacteria bacterium CG10_big_fil_rev_8_21_14_0_10_38_8]